MALFPFAAVNGGEEARLRIGFVTASGLGVVRERIDGKAAARREDACNFYIARLQKSRQILADDIAAIFMEIAMISE